LLFNEQWQQGLLARPLFSNSKCHYQHHLALETETDPATERAAIAKIANVSSSIVNALLQASTATTATAITVATTQKMKMLGSRQ
jgi:fatty-acid desaturase